MLYTRHQTIHWRTVYSRHPLEQHRDYAFQVATPSRWEVWICNDQMVKEYKNLMDEDFSANAVTADVSVRGALDIKP